MLLDDTSRLSQIAFALAIAGGVVALLGFVGNFTWLGILFLIGAGAVAATTIVRDRADASVWPAYGAAGIVLVGLLVAVPMALSANGAIEVARDGRVAREAFITRRPPLDAAVRACTPDTATGCSAAAILATAQAKEARVLASGNCTGADEICLADAPNDLLAWKYVTRPVPGVGSLRIDETRNRQNAVVETVCRPIELDADSELVQAACGDQLPVAGPPGQG